MADKVTEHDTHAGMHPWGRLMAEGSRLHVLYEEGRLQEVLDGVEKCRATIATLADPPDGDDTIPTWSIREGILGVGVAAAHGLGQWQRALDLNAAVRQSQENRKADEVDRAVTWFNDYGPLLRLHRADEARELLYQCRVVFGRAENVVMMGNTLSALADTDAHLGNLELAVEQETDALRMKYRGNDREAIAVSHYNLANHLIRAGADSQRVWAHRLAAALIRYQIGSSRLAASVQSIGRLLGERRPEPGSPPLQAPLSFNDVCHIVDSLPEVRFTELFGLLPPRAESGPAAIQEIMRLTESARGSAVEESLAAWEPIISAIVAAAQPDANEEITALVDDALDELAQQNPWQELVEVLRRVKADSNSAPAIHDLDPVSAAVATRAIAAVAGEVQVDPSAWRELVDQA
ncbi:MAG TPA: hypothetical protein VJX10_08240 [Pseudonocardiaceae bacterium]|nr:hypothetical protein [Pseudonocardiaceae bacterium]